jgi:GntR family transcriptional regulator
MDINDKNTDLPLYLQIKKDLDEKIERGVYTPDKLFPTEKELSEQYKVSRVTIRSVMGLLAKEGKITRKAGYGTILNGDYQSMKKFTMVKSFTTEMKESGAESQTLDSSLSILFADPHLMSIFKCGFSEKIYELKRLRGVGKKPINFSDTLLLLPIELPTTKEFLYGSLYAYLVSKDIYFSKFEEQIEAVMPTKEMASLLSIDKDACVLKRIRWGYDQKGKLIEYTVSYYDANLYKYNIEIGMQGK